MADYTSTHSGLEIDNAVDKVLSSTQEVADGDTRLLESGGAFSALLLKQNSIENGGDCDITENKIRFGQVAINLFNRIFKKPTSSYSVNKLLAIDNQNNEAFYSIGEGLKVDGGALKTSVQPVTKTTEMVQSVGMDSNGKLWTRVGGGGGIGNVLYKHEFNQGSFGGTFISPLSAEFGNLVALTDAIQINPWESSGIFLGTERVEELSAYRVTYIDFNTMTIMTTNIPINMLAYDNVTIWGE